MAVSENKISSVEELIEAVKDNHLTHKLLSSAVPDICKNEPCFLGVDEAGRGPVLGPMVYGICYTPVSRHDEFKTLGFADSKTLTDKKREEILEILCACEDYIGWAVDIISPNFICNKMLKREKYSLNEIAQDSTVALIKHVIESGANIAEIYVDTVGPPEKYQDKLSRFFPDCKVTVSKKADALFPVVSAASICAKVTRDKTIENWQFVENLSKTVDKYGSGYPNDPDTKKFLTEHADDVFGFPHLVRFSWSTTDKFLENSAVVEWPDEEGDLAPNTKQITSYFSKNISKNGHSMKHNFFKERLLSNVETL